ncbi:MAG TPA: carbohydrate kinase [Gammaproteobacteria bacterium]|nr:carbohydrate kinase [Gammaproteobacteria bacterium]
MDHPAAFVGIDVGTSGLRACAIDAHERVLADAAQRLPPPLRSGAAVEQDPGIWREALHMVLERLARSLHRHKVQRIALDGTSSTLLLCNREGRPLTPALMYNDARAADAAEQIAAVAPENSAARGASSSLAKLLWLRTHYPASDTQVMHQADWLCGLLRGRFDTMDENNALKLGYDPVQREWPAWLAELGIETDRLPRVRPPGTALGALDARLAQRLGWHHAGITAGTTDSTAGFLATGARTNGTGVSSLGSTLVLKVLSGQPVFSARHGIYSHRIGHHWLAGGASNSGGAVLRQFFGPCDIHRYSRLIDTRHPTGLDYYPLPAPGERFPVNDPCLQPSLTPRPKSDRVFFQAILEGIADIEAEGYQLLHACGAPALRQVLSVGAGASNRRWTELRRQRLRVPVLRAGHEQAAFGAARLALHGTGILG